VPWMLYLPRAVNEMTSAPDFRVSTAFPPRWRHSRIRAGSTRCGAGALRLPPTAAPARWADAPRLVAVHLRVLLLTAKTASSNVSSSRAERCS
jgi:hypothetical protein